MSQNSFEDKLKDLNLTNDELKRFSDAFKNDEFRKLFIEYAEEINDPKNRELYEQEIRAVEEQRGSDVTFVHPQPGHVLKTTVNGEKKCFINIATNEHVDKPSFTKADGTNGKQGAHWSLPHCLAGPHEDIDHDSKTCTVYDVIFSPDTYRMAETNAKFMKMLEESALDSVENNYHCKLDRNNIKKLKMKFKGVPKATIIRKKKENFQENNNNNDTENELKHDTDDIIEKAISTAQNHKVVLSSHNRNVNPPPSTNGNSAQTNRPRTDENGFTTPTYRIVHRGEFDMQDCTNSLVSQVRSIRPKELIVEIDLPLCASSNNVDLDVCERSLKLHCDSPKYSLDLILPYPVRESDSHARFDKKQRKLIVTLAVMKETPRIIPIEADVDMDDATESGPAEIIPSPLTTTTETVEKPSNITYTGIPYEYKQGLAHFALVLYVKNIDKTSLKIDNDGQHITVQLISLGSGSYPLPHQLCLDFDEPMIFDTNENSTTITFNDNNLLILFKKSSNNKQITQFSSGVDRDNMKTNTCITSVPDEKSNSTSKLAKEDFLVNKSDSSSSSSSSNSDQNRKISKRYAKKLAKENRKNHQTTDDNEKLANKISKITLQSNHDEQKLNGHNQSQKMVLDEKDDKLNDIPKVTSRPTIYRRHMSESQVDSEPASNGEFKLKGILKNATKYRSYSESLSEPLNLDFQGDEIVFERCPTNEDLTSSNENNSIGTSGDSSSLCTTPGSSTSVKHVTFNNQVSRKTFKPGKPVAGMKKLSTNQQRKLKKRKRQDSLNSQSSDQDDLPTSDKLPDDYENPIEFEDIISQEAANGESQPDTNDPSTATKSAVRFTNSLIFELDN